jgi:hypothetical protein
LAAKATFSVVGLSEDKVRAIKIVVLVVLFGRIGWLRHIWIVKGGRLAGDGENSSAPD